MEHTNLDRWTERSGGSKELEQREGQKLIFSIQWNGDRIGGGWPSVDPHGLAHDVLLNSYFGTKNNCFLILLSLFLF